MAIISSISNSAPVASAPLVQSSAASSSAPVQKPVLQVVAQSGAEKSANPKMTEQKVQHAVHQANQMLAASGSNETISFSYEAKLNQLYVKIVDQDSGRVVREIPSKDFIQHQIALREMIGMILDKTA